MGRTPCCSKVGLRRGSWSAKEDELLRKYIQEHGEGKWRSLPEKAGLLRCGKSCRLRWKNYLSPGIKRGDITPDEEDLIIRLHSLLGNRWSLIAGRLPARTDNEIKNHWNTQLVKRLSKDGIEPKSAKINVAKLPTQSEKTATPTQEDSSASIQLNNNADKKSKHNNSSSFCSGSEPVTMVKLHVPKPIRVRPRFSNSNTNNSMGNSSSPEEVSKEAMVDRSHFDTKAKAQVSLSAFSSLIELGDANYYSGSEIAKHNHVLISDGEFSFEDLLAGRVPLQDSEAVSLQHLLTTSCNSMQENIYDEYLQLL